MYKYINTFFYNFTIYFSIYDLITLGILLQYSYKLLYLHHLDLINILLKKFNFIKNKNAYLCKYLFFKNKRKIHRNYI